MQVKDPSSNPYVTFGVNGAADMPQEVRKKRTDDLPPILPPDEALYGQLGSDDLAVVLAPPNTSIDGSSQASIDEMTQSLDEAMGKMAFDIRMVLQMMVKMAQGQREAAQIERHAETSLQAAAMDKQAQSQRDAADMERSAAWVSGAMGIAGGAAAVTGGAVGLSKIKTANTKAEIEVTKAQQKSFKDTGMQLPKAEANKIHMDKFQSLIRDIDSITAVCNGLSQVLQGIGGIGKGNLDRDAAYIQARKTLEEKVAMLHQAAGGIANDRVQALADFLRTVMDTLRGIDQKTSEMRSGIARNI